ncbi:MAG: cupin domain-containing protein [Haloferacaceae archaeon]
MESVDEDEVGWTDVGDDSARFRRKRLASAARGGEPAPDDGLGASLYELPPGAEAWPYHYHAGNEEALYALSGTGQVRGPDGAEPLEPGEFVLFPTGPEGAHRVVNDGDTELRYLVVSTMRDPDVTVYPDADAVGVYAGAPPGGDGERDVSGYLPRSARVDYWTEVAETEERAGADGEREDG